MSDTPRTDALENKYGTIEACDPISVSHDIWEDIRQLERELAEAKTEAVDGQHAAKCMNETNIALRAEARRIAPSGDQGAPSSTKLNVPSPETVEHITHEERVVAVVDPADYEALWNAATGGNSRLWSSPSSTRDSVIDEIEKVIGAMEGRHFTAIGTATSEEDKRRHGIKTAFAMELRAAIRAIKSAQPEAVMPDDGKCHCGQVSCVYPTCGWRPAQSPRVPKDGAV